MTSVVLSEAETAAVREAVTVAAQDLADAQLAAFVLDVLCPPEHGGPVLLFGLTCVAAQLAMLPAICFGPSELPSPVLLSKCFAFLYKVAPPEARPALVKSALVSYVNHIGLRFVSAVAALELLFSHLAGLGCVCVLVDVCCISIVSTRSLPEGLLVSDVVVLLGDILKPVCAGHLTAVCVLQTRAGCRLSMGTCHTRNATSFLSRSQVHCPETVFGLSTVGG